MTLILWAIRFFAFHLEESPRFLVGRGRDAEAVAVIHRIAAHNGRTSSLTVEQLTEAGEKAAAEEPGATVAARHRRLLSESSAFSVYHIRGLFETPKLAWSTGLLIFLWGKAEPALSKSNSKGSDLCVGIIGLASTLYNSFLPYLLVVSQSTFMYDVYKPHIG